MSRKGDWFLAPYKFKKFWFVNVYGRLPRRPSVGERETLGVLCRANIDIFWSQYTATMKGILGYKKEILRRAKEGGRLMPLTEINSWPIGDKVGMDMDIQMLESYLCKVINRRDYLQFNTVCKLRAEVSNV